MPAITLAQRLTNLESALVAAQKRLSKLATDDELAEVGKAMGDSIAALEDKVQSFEEEIKVLSGIITCLEEDS